MAKKPVYNNESITSLKGADRVRRRPAVIFGSDGLEGCEHSIFEIVSNSIDEAREGYGKKIVVTRYNDDSVEVEDFGRGIPVDYNNAENRYNWELVFCEMYAGGKYKNATANLLERKREILRLEEKISDLREEGREIEAALEKGRDFWTRAEDRQHRGGLRQRYIAG